MINQKPKKISSYAQRDMTRVSKNNLPFLKWAGGKRWLISSGASLAPKKFTRYVEPFLGSGSVFFHLSPKKSLLADTNEELIHAFTAIKLDWRLVEQELKVHAQNHCDKYYYEVRGQLPCELPSRAARFIYLNRTCWNGLYRVNLRGEFNVPRGSKDTVLLPTDDFRSISELLRESDLVCQDFEETLESTRKGDFIFVDPPYTVNHNKNGFLRYNERIFSWEDQLRLRESVAKAVERGAMVSMSNADHPSIHELYKGLGTIERIQRMSVLAGSSKHRGATTELLIRIGWNT